MYSFIRRLVYQHLRPDKTSVTNFSTECLSSESEINSFIIEIKEKGGMPMTLHLSIIKELELEALKDILAQFKVMAQGSRRT